MTPPTIRIQDIKSGRIREITQYAHKINQKHGNDKYYVVLPTIEDIKRIEEIIEKDPEPIPTYDPYTNEMTMDEFEQAEIEPVKEKKKRGRKSKNHNNE